MFVLIPLVKLLLSSSWCISYLLKVFLGLFMYSYHSNLFSVKMCIRVLYKWSVLLLSNLDSTVKCTCVSSTESHLTIRTQIEENSLINVKTTTGCSSSMFMSVWRAWAKTLNWFPDVSFNHTLKHINHNKRHCQIKRDTDINHCLIRDCFNNNKLQFSAQHNQRACDYYNIKIRS